MEEIRVVVTIPARASTTETTTISAKIGNIDVTEFVLQIRMLALRPYLPAGLRTWTGPRRQRMIQVRSFLIYHYSELSLEAFTEAVKGYLDTHRAEATGEARQIIASASGDDEIAARLANAGAGHLMIGGRMFRMTAVDESPTPQRLLAHMRRTAAEAVRTHRDAMIAEANREARLIRSQVESERQEFQQEQARFRSEIARTRPLPGWLNEGRWVVKPDGARISVMVDMIYRPTQFIYPEWRWTPQGRSVSRTDDLTWPSIDSAPVNVKMWIPFELGSGRYDVSNCYVDRSAWSGPVLPHIKHTGACVQPGGEMPRAITSATDVIQLRDSIQRAFRVVNMGSLFTTPAIWSPEVKAFMPEGCLKLYEGRCSVEESGAEYGDRENPDAVWHLDDFDAFPPAPEDDIL